MKADQHPSPSPYVVVPPTDSRISSKVGSIGTNETTSEITSDSRQPPAASAEPSTPPSHTTNPPSIPNLTYRKWLTVALVALGIGGVALLPIPNYVSGRAEVTSREEERHKVTMPGYPGIVRVNLRRNDKVDEGQVVARIDSHELEEAIAEAERELTQAHDDLSAAIQQRELAQRRLQEARTDEAIALDRATKQQEELQRLEHQDTPSARRLNREVGAIEEEIAALEYEAAGIEKEMAGVYAEIDGLNREIAALRDEEKTTADRIEKYERLVDLGVIAEEDHGMQDLKQDIRDTQRQIVERENQIAIQQERIGKIQHRLSQQDRAIAQKQQLIGGKQEQILENYDDVLAGSDDTHYQVEQTSVAKDSAAQELDAAAVDILNKRKLVRERQRQLNRLDKQREDLVLLAEMSGTVLTDNLDTTNGNYLQAGEEILTLVNLDRLTATIYIRQEDKPLILLGQQVRFQAHTSGREYKATVDAVAPYIKEESGQRPMLQVQLSIDNQENGVLLGTEGYAHIRVEDMQVYRKIGHELGKVFSLGKYFPWLQMGKSASVERS